MPQERANKEQRLHKTFNPVFTSASTFYHFQKASEVTTSIQDTLKPTSPQISEIQEKLDFYRQKLWYLILKDQLEIGLVNLKNFAKAVIIQHHLRRLQIPS